MMNPLENKISGDMLRWARKTAGFSIEEMEKKLNKQWKSCTEGTLIEWEEGVTAPTLTQIYFLAKYYKRPIAIFFTFIEPPEDETPEEFRSMGSTPVFNLSPKVRFALRKAKYLQSQIQYLREATNNEVQNTIMEANASDSPTELASRLREDFNYNHNDYNNVSDAFNYLRDKIELQNILVLKYSYHKSFPLEDARAFALTNEEPFVIGINNKDTENAKLFSLLHELGHIILRDDDLTNETISLNEDTSVDPIETFCNQFAGSFLVPERVLLELYDSTGDVEQQLARLATTFNVSQSVISKKLFDLDLIDRELFFAVQRKAIEGYRYRLQNKPSGGRLYPVSNVVNSFGKNTTDLVVQSYRDNIISALDVKKLFDLKVKHIPDLLNNTYG